jgi:Fe-S cluster assembly iron-binding protein IscA
MLNITDGAADKFIEFIEQQGRSGSGIRIFTVKGG